MPASAPDLLSLRDWIAWNYANLARAHAAINGGRTRYVQIDHIVRARLFKGLRTQAMSIRSIYDDERLKYLGEKICAYCGTGKSLTVDHILPKIAGGHDDGANLVLACRPCNSSKNGRDLMEWYLSRDAFPPLLILRRYLKLIAMYGDAHDLLDFELTSLPGDMPFKILPGPIRFPSLDQLQL